MDWKEMYFNLMDFVASLRWKKMRAEGKLEIAKDMLLETVNRVHELEATVARLEKQLVIDQRFALERDTMKWFWNLYLEDETVVDELNTIKKGA
jgi:BMFP domain-containing protein YqiC